MPRLRAARQAAVLPRRAAHTATCQGGQGGRDGLTRVRLHGVLARPAGETHGPASYDSSVCALCAPERPRAPCASAWSNHARPCAAPPHRREPHPLNNVTRPHGLSLGRPKGEATLPSMTDRRVETPLPDVGPMLQLLQFEVGMHRDDPSTRVWLQRAAETEGLTEEHEMSSCWASSASSSARAGLHSPPGLSCNSAHAPAPLP